MGWELWTLEGMTKTAGAINSALQAEAIVLSRTPVQQLVVDQAALDAIKQITNVDISPIVNNLGETIGYAGAGSGAANGVSGIANTWVEIHKTATTVTQEMIDSAIPVIGGGSSADFSVGDVVTAVGAGAATGVGGALGTGVGTTAFATVAGPAIAAAIGVEWGVALYELAPEFWISVADKLDQAGRMIGDKVVSFFDKNGNTYYDETTIGIVRQALIDEGIVTPEDFIPTDYTLPDYGTVSVATAAQKPIRYNSDTLLTVSYKSNAKTVIKSSPDQNGISCDLYSETNNINVERTVTVEARNPKTTYDDWVGNRRSVRTKISGKTIYFATASSSNFSGNAISNISYNYPFLDPETVATILFDGTPVAPAAPTVKTIPFTPNGTNPDGSTQPQVAPIPTANTSPLQTKISTKTDPYPYFDPYVSPTGSSTLSPSSPSKTNPQNDPQKQVDPVVTPDPNPTEISQTEEKTNPDIQDDPISPENPPINPEQTNPPTPPTPPPGDSGNGDDGNTPEPVPPLPMPQTGLGNIYNPSDGAMQALSEYMWNITTIDDIKKLFQNPTDGIIAFMKLYATPHTGAGKNICLGYLDSGVGAPLVTQQITVVECGKVTVPTCFGNATDYPPYTTAQAYLPFIGIVQLNSYDIVDSEVTCTYRVDCYTGACIAQLQCKRGNMDAVLYEFSGNCAQQLPLTSGSFVQAVGNTISGAVIGGLTGGAVGAAIGAGSALLHSNVEIGRSGNLSANAGILGSRIPYIILTRPIALDATNYSEFYGFPANKTVYLINCHGFTKVKDIILHCSCTDEERDEILSLLHEGIYI